MYFPTTDYLAAGAASMVALFVACGVQQQWAQDLGLYSPRSRYQDLGLYPALLLLHIMELMIHITTSHSLVVMRHGARVAALASKHG